MHSYTKYLLSLAFYVLLVFVFILHVYTRKIPCRVPCCMCMRLLHFQRFNIQHLKFEESAEEAK